MALDVNELVMMLRANGQHLEADHVQRTRTGPADPGLTAELLKELRTSPDPQLSTLSVGGQLTGDQAMLGSITGAR